MFYFPNKITEFFILYGSCIFLGGTPVWLSIQGIVIHFNLHMMKLRRDEWTHRLKVSHCSRDMSTKVSSSSACPFTVL